VQEEQLNKGLKMNRILAVDDEQYNLNAIKRQFADLDCKMEFARNGEQALEIIPGFMPDLVILDIMMPGIDGYEVCRRLKSDSNTKGIMVLLLSAKGGIQDRLSGYGVQADDYIIKPYDPKELKAKAEILLRLKKAQDELFKVNQNLEKLVEEKTRQLVKKERQAIIGLMVQGLVHNLKGPVMVIKLTAELIQADINEFIESIEKNFEGLREVKENIYERFEMIFKGIGQLEMLINNLLAKGREEANDERQDLNLNDIITKEFEFLNADLNMKSSIKKTLNLDPTLPAVSGTYSDFSQVVYNLVKNASDAMKNSPKKEIIVSSKHDGEHIYLIFQDTGSGIAPENLDRIFDPFFTTKAKVGSEEKGEAMGTGLGLHVCSQLMDSYGAKICVKSQPGKGTTFTIAVPNANFIAKSDNKADNMVPQNRTTA
jgi:signal transduction histidine kinase